MWNNLEVIQEMVEHKKEREYCWWLYLSLISFEDCHNPWMLHNETAMMVPGLLVLSQVVTAW
jgi:hypothetical protein